MRDLGVAVDMNYGESASGTNHGSAATGLQNYFGLKDAKKLDRKACTEPAWMDIIYQQLNNNLPIVYGGLDATAGGHSFVFDGYDKEGRVHVNWGWYGEDNGYFYVADLNPYHGGNAFAFNSAQDMIININPDVATDHLNANVSLSEAGTLYSRIDATKKFDYDTLKVTGPVNGTDIRLIREMAGRDAQNGLTEGRLHVLDLKDARIVSGGDAYLTEDGKEYRTADDALTDKIFYGCSFLTVTLPEGIKTVGDGVLAFCNGLDSVSLSDADAENFKVVDGTIYNKVGDEVISVLPNKTGNLYFTKGITKIHPYALAGCNHISSRLPSRWPYRGKTIPWYRY
ncbi:MAG: C10 family peptidase [Prevotellaceae bacterium]|nr:C10 family peptidase [Prevotellaceae bacterium]